MLETIIASLITGGLALVGVIISNNKANAAMAAEAAKAQAVTDTKLEELTREVREHNGFARRMPVVEEQIKEVKDDIKALKKYHSQPYT